MEACDKIPDNFVSEWFMNASRVCLIPGKDNDKHNITSKHPAKGQLLTFQFIVESPEGIKCYIIWNGQTS